ncbi:hypothetical protein BTA51_02435 [Hahella sp. CCB-MM4]|uniref:bifunctional diguanylate cyclase/phosphodiesterase n=1 Tax=Hahella sp. (strain CCB-MM4) TaxID=1926491 RepID=UPI000B9A613A|nr:EAL domain-containing protein [Hahella sp. CCB-MM4]OZG75262.1 hypothetical protein BTA51_02435 [Hahella sp. CCB-MM4]
MKPSTDKHPGDHQKRSHDESQSGKATVGSELRQKKLGIGLKLGLLLSVFAVMASGLTGYYTFTQSRSMLVKSAESELLTSTQVLGRRLSIVLAEIESNVRLLSQMPSAHILVGSPQNESDDQPRDHLTQVFINILNLHPEYFQIRLVGQANYGKELVRVDREADKLSVVPQIQLQEKAQYPYVYETLGLEPDKIYLSRININHEFGAHQGLNKPTLQMAAPVTSTQGDVAGLIVINIDLDGLFKLLQADLPSNILLYLTNQEGDFLIHPDRSQEFGFDRGRSILIQDSFPATEELFNNTLSSLVFNMSPPPTRDFSTGLIIPGRELAGAFTKLPLGELAPDRFLVLGLAIPLESVFAGTHQLGRNIIHIVIAFSVLAILVAMITSRAVSKPLNMMVNAVRRFSDKHVMGELPIKQNDEIGLLARTFMEMQSLLTSHLDDLHQKERHLHHLAQHDTLTNLPNRMLLFDRMRHAIAKAHRTDKQLALIFIDLDRFKDINDSLGHAVGDEVIKSVAQNLARLLRDEDTVARLGGDEFIVVLEAVDNIQQVTSTTQKLLLKLQQPIHLEGQDLYLSASMGISLYPQDGDDAETLLRNADAAMYRAKEEGRNMFHFYTEDMTTSALARVNLEGEIRQALDYGGFIPYYQPQIDLETGELIGIEALARWHHTDGRLLTPSDFIALAEDTGLIESIGIQILESACHQIKTWYDSGLNPGRVAVNISGKQLRKRDLSSKVFAILTKTQCDPKWLELEITESFFMDRPDDAIAILEDLREAGIELAIDDFGTGYSSLSYLKHLPISKLKIDRSFIGNIPVDEDDKTITCAIIALAKSLELRVIAEGVETEQQHNFLVTEGCDEAQGFYYSQAVTVGEIENMLKKKATA